MWKFFFSVWFAVVFHQYQKVGAAFYFSAHCQPSQNVEIVYTKNCSGSFTTRFVIGIVPVFESAINGNR